MYSITTQWARKFKKVQAKKLVKSNKSNIFFVKLHFWQFYTFHSSKIDFWPFLKMQKIEFGQKKNLWNWFIWFHEFFGLDFFKFSGPLWRGLVPQSGKNCLGSSKKLLGSGRVGQNTLGLGFDPTHPYQKHSSSCKILNVVVLSWFLWMHRFIFHSKNFLLDVIAFLPTFWLHKIPNIVCTDFFKVRCRNTPRKTFSVF